jgi:NADPH-dependent 2,4-dienoyl-CoA reductase/sulfur reductase-like enzyme/nitrite reductase/ring-hydroxylating ferredoxin subunit
MDEQKEALAGPDLVSGVPLAHVADGAMLLGHAHGEQVLLARRGSEVFAVGASCTHYHAPLNDGLLVGDTIRCPWHHACFNLRTGAADCAPALDALARWKVEQREGKVYVGEKLEPVQAQRIAPAAGIPKSVTIVGGGAAGNAAAEMLRREGYAGPITMLSADASAPYDRPNLSKSFLAGTAPPDWIPLRPTEFYPEQRIDLKLNAAVAAIDVGKRQLQMADGSRHDFDTLLLATGAEPIRLDIPGATLPHVQYLRTFADSQAIVDKATTAKKAVVIGASFIGMEVAAALRARDIEVHVVAPDAVPMERILGPEMGNFIRQLHGVHFHLGTTAVAMDAKNVSLKNGESLAADLVVVGIGVRPNIGLAQQAGLAVDRGVKVDEYLQTSVPGIYAAGDIARWPDRLTGERLRVEHWVVAERQGQTAARNILGRRERFDAVPFFWSEQYDFGFSYVGNAPGWDQVEMHGQLDENTQDCTLTYRRAGKKLAVVTVHRDMDGLKAEVELERAIAASA